MSHGIILHEEYRERMKNLSPEDLGKLVINMFRVDDGEELEVFEDKYLDLLSETICGRVARDIELSERQRARMIGKQNATKTPNNSHEKATKKPKKSHEITPITNNQLPITNKPIKDIYGEAQNVLLTKEEYQKIKDKGLTELIEELSLYMASKKKTYADHYMTILAWGRRREKEKPVSKPNQFTEGVQRSSYDMSELEKKLIKN